MSEETHPHEDDTSVNDDQLGNPEPAKAHWPSEDPVHTRKREEHADSYDARKTAAGAAKPAAPQQARDVLRSRS